MTVRERMGVETLLAVLLGLALAAPAGAAETDGGVLSQGADYRFGVYYQGRRIGEHRWQVVQIDGMIRIASRARFDVKVLFVPVYRYRHAANELWKGECLEALAAVTDDNGREQRVSGARQAAPELAGFVSEEKATRVPLGPGCAGSFAYWDVDRLDRSRLINVQTGESVPAVLTRKGEASYLGETAIRYDLQAGNLPLIELWYRKGDQQWLGLRTVRDGAELAYRLEAREALPAAALDPREDMPVPSI